MERRVSQSEPGWHLFRSFLEVLREGSLSGAARELGLTQPTIGRHIEALEQALELVLFTRSGHGLAPTEAALELRPHAEAIAANTAALLRAASGQGVGTRGTVRISASEVLGAEVLPPILARLREENPELVVELVLSDRIEDLLRRDADIAVRQVRPTQQALVARRLGVIELGLYAHRRYLDRCGTPDVLDDLRAHTVIGFDRETAFIRGLRAQLGGLDRGMFALRTDSWVVQLAGIRAGYGIGGCQVGLARRDPELVRVLPTTFSIGLETWLVMHEDLRGSRRCRVAFDALSAGLAGYIASARKTASPEQRPNHASRSRSRSRTA